MAAANVISALAIACSNVLAAAYQQRKQHVMAGGMV